LQHFFGSCGIATEKKKNSPNQFSEGNATLQLLYHMSITEIVFSRRPPLKQKEPIIFRVHVFQFHECNRNELS